MALRFMVKKTAITVMTPPVGVHGCPLQVTHVFLFAVLLRNQGRITAESRRNHGGITAESRRNHGGITAESRRNHGGITAESRRNHGGITAEPRRCHCGHSDPIELPLRFDGNATAIIGGRTAGPVMCQRITVSIT